MSLVRRESDVDASSEHDVRVIPPKPRLPTRETRRTVVIDGHKTSVNLESEFWNALADVADANGVTRQSLIRHIAGHQRGLMNLSSAIRVLVLAHYRQRAASGAAVDAARATEGC